ncbi:MAG: hypothetical protein V4638_03335 [Bacteroidota bacterium]
MFGRFLLIFLAIIALGWTTYVAFDIIDKDTDYSAATVFGKEDGEVLVIHRFKEYDPFVFPFETTLQNKSLLESLDELPTHVISLYVSALRDNILFESTTKWTKSSVKNLLRNTELQPIFTGINSFTTKAYSGTIYKNKLYLSKLVSTTTPIEQSWTKFDMKSSLTHVVFKDNSVQTTDLYLKNGGRIDYVTKSDENLSGKQVNDKELFVEALPVSIDTYHFYEKEFLAFNDLTFKKGPMYQWIDRGFVFLETKGKKVIICDFKESQNPINSLFDFKKQDPDNRPYGFFDNVQLFEGFPSRSTSSFYVYNMDNFAVISESQELCEEIVANYRLGNTLSQHEDLIAEIYGQLPSMVSERYIGKETKYTKAVYNKKLFETVFPKISKNAENIAKEQESSYQSYKLGGKIHDVFIDKGEGNFVAITTKGFIRAYRNGTKLWEKHLNGQAVGKISKSKWKEMPHWVITTKNGIHVLDEAGNYPLGFPIVAADKQLTTSKIYTWKGRSWALGLNTSGEILVYNQAGQRDARIKTGLSASSNEIEVWQSQGKIFYGVYDASNFKMYEANSRSEYRSFALPSNSQAVKVSNQLLFFACVDDRVIATDQKGNQNSLGNGWSGFTLTSCQENSVDGKIYLTLWKDNVVKVIDEKGNIMQSATTEALSISNVYCDLNINQKTVLSVVDDIENNVYLYQLNGELIGEKPLEGSQIAKVTTTRLGEYLLSTIVDDFIIQHTIK